MQQTIESRNQFLRVNAGFFSTPRVTTALLAKSSRPLAQVLELYHYLLAYSNWGAHKGAAKGEMVVTLKVVADYFSCSSSTILYRLSKLKIVGFLDFASVGVSRDGVVDRARKSIGRYSHTLIKLTPVRTVSKMISDCFDFKKFIKIKNRTLKFRDLLSAKLKLDKRCEENEIAPVETQNEENRTLNPPPSIYSNEKEKINNPVQGKKVFDEKVEDRLFAKAKRKCLAMIQSIERKEPLTQPKARVLELVFKSEHRFVEQYRSAALNPSIGDPASLIGWRVANWFRRKNALSTLLDLLG